MAENNEKTKSVQYTYGTDEKETLRALDTVEASVERRLAQKESKLISTRYYKEFVINTEKGQLILENVFITSERDKNGEVTEHFRWIVEGKDGNKTIEENIVVDSEGKAYTSTQELGKYLEKLHIDIESLVEKNDKENGRLKGISEEADEKDMERSLENKEESKQQNEKDIKEEKPSDKQVEVEKDLKKQGQDLSLGKFREIKDNHLQERMPEVFNNSVESAVAYSNKLHRFVILTKQNGEWQLNENVEPARMTFRTILSIDEKGEQIERKVPHALMRTNNSNKEIAVTIGDYGEVDIETVDVMPCQERVARQVGMQGEGIEGQESLEVRRDFETEGKQYTHEIAHQVKEIEGENKEHGIDDATIDRGDYIPNTQITWGELSDITGDSVVNLVERYNREMEQDGATSEEVVETIEADYGNVSHEHVR